RLPRFLRIGIPHLDDVLPGAYEVTVVDDGSQDGLSERLDCDGLFWPRLRLIRHESNLGKGAAVRMGIRFVKGRFVLLCDADGACPIQHEWDLRRAIETGADIAIGSRMVKGQEWRSERLWYRNWLGR